MGDTYNIGQINAPSAVGKNAKIEQLQWQQTMESVDVSDLFEQLKKLRLAMKQDAVEPDHDVAISSVALAEIAAKEGKKTEALKHLKSAGKWALQVATKIGSDIAVAALKAAMTL
jgi:hypothetical protein